MRTNSPKAKSPLDLKSVITATKKLWRQYHLTYDQTHYIAKEVSHALAIERPKTRTRVVARLSGEEEHQPIADAYRVQGTRGSTHQNTTPDRRPGRGVREHQSRRGVF